MNNYLINPWWLYLIDVCANFEVVAVTLVFIGAIGIVIGGVSWVMDFGYHSDTEEKQIKSILKFSTVVTIIASMVICIIPSTETMYAMFVTSYITEENLDGAADTVTGAVDYIFEKIDELEE